jgi:hypothetical protein
MLLPQIFILKFIFTSHVIAFFELIFLHNTLLKFNLVTIYSFIYSFMLKELA